MLSIWPIKYNDDQKITTDKKATMDSTVTVKNDRVSRHQYLCLICGSERRPNSKKSPNCSSFSSPPPPEKEEEVNIEFVLQHVFELGSELIQNYQKCHGGSEEFWVKFCEDCGSNYVDKCKLIFLELLEVKKRFGAARLEVIEAVKRSIQVEETDAPKEKNQNVNFGIWKEIRNYVGKCKYEDSIAEEFPANLQPKLEELEQSDVESEDSQEIKDEQLSPSPSFSNEPEDHWINDNSRSSEDENDEDPKNQDKYDEDNHPESSEDESSASSSKSIDQPTSIPIPPKTTEKPQQIPRPPKRKRVTNKRFKCDLCPEAFYTQKRLQRHQIRTHKTNLHKCAQCDWKTGDMTFMADHMKRYHGTMKDLEDLTCSLCSKILSSKKSLTSHMNYSHSGKKKPKYFCVHCGKEFTDKRHYLTHLGTIHGVEDQLKVFCQVPGCGKGFSSKSLLTAHENKTHKKMPRKVTPKGQFPCPTCDSILSTEYILKLHIRNVHEKRNQFCCHLCGQVLQSNYLLTMHNLVVHKIGDKKLPVFQCEVEGCTKSYCRKGLLIAHVQRKHEKIRPYQCEQCGVSKFTNFELKKHIKNQHSGNLGTNFSCNSCGKKFQKKASLTRHKNSQGH